jgi:tetratricopeptide (TPR) repeat protein
VLGSLKQFDAALESLAKAIALDPQYAEAYNNQASALVGKGDLKRALKSYDLAMRLKPGYMDAIEGRKRVLKSLNAR